MALHERFREIPGVNFNKNKHEIVTAVAGFLIPKVTLVEDSQENLLKMQELRGREKSVPVELFPRHISNIDAPAIYKMLVDQGYNDIADDLVFILGNRLKLNLFRRLTDAYPHITVWPPTIPAITEEEIQVQGEMNSLAERATKEVLERGGAIVIFAQGGREKGERFKPFEIGTGGYLSMRREMAVFPIALDETDKVLVPAPTGVVDRIPHRHSVLMHVGEPIDTAGLRARFNVGKVATVFEQRLGYIHEKLLEGQGKIAWSQTLREQVDDTELLY